MMLIAGAAVIIIYSGKRSVLLVSILSILLLYSSYFKFSIGRFIVISAVLVASYFFYDSVFASAKRTQFRVAKAIDDENQDTSIQARVIIYNNYLQVFKLYPVFGTGLRGGTLISEEINRNQFKTYSFHNTYLAYLVETGVIGFLAFLIIITRSFYQAFHKLPLSYFLLYLSFAIPSIVISVSENNALPGQALFWSLWLVLLMPRAFNSFITNATTNPKP